MQKRDSGEEGPNRYPLCHERLDGAEASIDDELRLLARPPMAKSLVGYKSVSSPHPGIENSSVRAVRSRLMQMQVKWLVKDGRPNRTTFQDCGEGLDSTQSLLVGLG